MSIENKLADMTLDELNNLPIEEFFDYDAYTIGPDKTVTLPNGRVLHGLRGDTIRVPRARKQRCVAYGPDDPVCWWDNNGECWAPAVTEDGKWARYRFSLF
jgi:hypothetical protein